jgi:DNA-binding transcriptional regulator YiaG
MNMKQARQKLGLSLSEFAELHQVSVLAVRRWEYPVGSSGHREPSGSAVAFTQALLTGKLPELPNRPSDQEKVK